MNIHIRNHKQYSLILDLNETLIHFKKSPVDEDLETIKIRPFLYQFLEDIGKYYELIIFTCSSENYCNKIIDAIEQNKIYFEHRLYRQHTNIKSFLGKDNKDIALFDLSKFLINNAKEGGDIRKGLVKYKDEILEKVTSNNI